jgi:DevC protein
MKTHKGNVGAIVADIGRITLDTLDKFDIPYDEIHFGKPYANFYIDDLAVNANSALDKALGIYSIDTPSRSFNKVEYNNKTVTKYTSNEGEVYWYNNIPPDIESYFPKVITASGNNRKITVAGLFQLGTSFGSDGNLITSQLNFLRIFSQRQKGLIEVGLIKLKSGINADQFKQKLQIALPPDVIILTKQEWIDFEKNYWMTSTAIGFIFTLGVGMGLIVGIVVVYQILYTDVTEHLHEYATLKAIGYKHHYFLFLVFQEAFILAILGYVPGFLVASGLYHLAKQATLLPIMMTQERILLVFSLTLLMCFLAGAIAIQKLQAADPADIF